MNIPRGAGRWIGVLLVVATLVAAAVIFIPRVFRGQSSHATEPALTVQIDATAGATVSHQGGLTVRIRPNGINQDAVLHIREVMTDPSGGLAAIGSSVSPAFDLDFDVSVKFRKPAILSFQLAAGTSRHVAVARLDEKHGEWSLVPSQPSVTEGRVEVKVEHFSTYQAFEIDPSDIESAIDRRFRKELKHAARANMEVVSECASVAGFEVTVDSSARIPPVTACLETRSGRLLLVLYNLRDVGLLFTPPAGTRVVHSSGASVWEKATATVDGLAYGSVLIPGNGRVDLEVPVDSAFPLLIHTALDSSSLLYESMTSAITGLLGPSYAAITFAEAKCAAEVMSEGRPLRPGTLLECLDIPFEAIPEGVLKKFGSGLIALAKDGGSFVELVRAMFGEAPPTVAIRRTDEQLPESLSAAFDESFVYRFRGFRYRATIHFGQIRFPVEHSCDQETASPGWTWIEIPYTIENLQSDRHAQVVAPILVLVNVPEAKRADFLERYFGKGTETLDPHQMRFGTEPDSCDILSGDFSESADGIEPGGRMDGTYVTSNGWSKGAINERNSLSDYVIVVYTGAGAFYDLEGTAGPWDVFGNEI